MKAHNGSMMYFLGIDVGLSGAVALLDHDGKFIAVESVPIMASGKGGAKVTRQINAAGLCALLRDWKYPIDPDDSAYSMRSMMAVVESASAMPKQGVASVFSLGQSFGIILGVLAALEISYQLVRPAQWKQYYGLSRDKEQARAKAIQLYPFVDLHRKQDHGKAEALLLARYGCMVWHD